MSKYCTVKEAVKIVEQYGRNQIKKYNLKGWKFHVFTDRVMDSIQNMKNKQEGTPEYYMLGFCCPAPVRVIAVRKSVIYQNPASVKKLVMHEIAHALCDPDEGHSQKFRKLSKRLGGYVNKCV